MVHKSTVETMSRIVKQRRKDVGLDTNVGGRWQKQGMKQTVLCWSKKQAKKKYARARKTMKSIWVQRKPTKNSQADTEDFSKGSLPYKLKKTSSSTWHKWELLAITGPICLLLYIALCYENFHFHVAHMYAHLGYLNAQHIVGQRYLKGTGVEKNEEKAMQWFRQAAEKGHPHSSFNLAVGKLKNITSTLEEGDVEKLLNIAAGYGLQEAQDLLENMKNKRPP